MSKSKLDRLAENFEKRYAPMIEALSGFYQCGVRGGYEKEAVAFYDSLCQKKEPKSSSDGVVLNLELAREQCEHTARDYFSKRCVEGWHADALHKALAACNVLIKEWGEKNQKKNIAPLLEAIEKEAQQSNVRAVKNDAANRQRTTERVSAGVTEAEQRFTKMLKKRSVAAAQQVHAGGRK